MTHSTTLVNTPFKPIDFENIPSREELRELTLKFMSEGETNSEAIRGKITNRKRLIPRFRIGKRKMNVRWNETPTDKFINEHAWVLEDLVVNHVIEKMSEKEYRLT
jgi:hypothetical protein